MRQAQLHRRNAAPLWFCAIVLVFSAARAGAAEEESHAHAAAGSADGASSHESEHEGVDYDKPPLNFEPPLFVWSLLLFLVLVFVGRKLAWDPLIAGLDSREVRINQAYAHAESAKEQVQQLIAQHEAHMAAAQDQVKAIVAESRQEAERLKAEITDAAAVEAQALQERVIADIQQAKQQALAELSATSEQYTTLATEHVLGYTLAGR
jgi:F-type H+-transporting ATPase subunit b